MRKKSCHRREHPTLYTTQRKLWYGIALDAFVCTSPTERIGMGRHDTEEQAQAAFEHWKKTGERPTRRFHRRAPHQKN